MKYNFVFYHGSVFIALIAQYAEGTSKFLRGSVRSFSSPYIHSFVRSFVRREPSQSHDTRPIKNTMNVKVKSMGRSSINKNSRSHASQYKTCKRSQNVSKKPNSANDLSGYTPNTRTRYDLKKDNII